jgi:hypothetical protein
VPETIDINSLKPNTSEITTGQVMELLPQESIFPYGKRVIARTYNSSILMNGVQGAAGSNPAVPMMEVIGRYKLNQNPAAINRNRVLA